MRSAFASILLLLLCMPAAQADEVIFKNGDRLSGTIQKLDGRKLTISTKVAGDVNVDIEDVKTFSADKPLEIHMADGSVLRQTVVQAGEGQFATAPGGTVQPQTFPIASVASINPPPVKWTGNLIAGAMITRGNSDSDNANVEFNATRRSADDRISVDLGYFYGRQKDNSTGETSTSTDNWFAAGKYDYFFTPRFYGYGNARVEKDRIADLDLRFVPGAGIGYQWLQNARTNFSTEVGGAWVYEQYTTGETNQHVAARLAYHVDYKFNDKVSFFHDLEFLPSVENLSDYLFNAQAGVRASLTTRMFAEAKMIWRFNSKPPDNAEESDFRYVLGVGWTF